MYIFDHHHSLPAPLYSSEQVRELDRRLIAAGTPGWVLMQRAARATFATIMARWPEARSLCVVCGKGNNGGDGFLVARLAADKGFAVSVIQIGIAEEQTSGVKNGISQSDAQRARAAFIATGIEPVNWCEGSSTNEAVVGLIESADITVDAMLGTGLTGELRAQFVEPIELINRKAKQVVAVDIPSGISSDSGLALGQQAIKADLTVTFIGLKKGLFTSDGKEHVGELVFDDLQADRQILDAHPHNASLSHLPTLAQSIPQRTASAFKNSSGHLLVIGGNSGMGGAPLLTASAAIRCGAGLVSIATRPESCAAIIAHQPELMVRGMEKTLDIMPMLEKAHAVVIGPGLGQDGWAQQLLVHSLVYLLETRPLPLLLDADALNLLAVKPDIAKLFERVQSLDPENVVLTPHPGEAARLVGARMTDRYALMNELVKAFGSTVVLKGAGTLIGQDDQIRVCPYGNPVLATAGSGDVLSGVIGALMAQGLPAFEAAELGVCLHAAAADYYYIEYGSKGMTAGDLPDLLVDLLNQFLPG